jgi:hypothetical protein
METAKADEIAGLTVPWIGDWHRCKKLDGYCIGKLAAFNLSRKTVVALG